ncbi:barstar family protein [Desertihabitans aurantiacus]|uniref:barstar family protein n=1 Tax=Desertihabitans aurantiacus TaxID=2282477 RepID=UPI0013003A95|nr:barstar family protein [Desertihabitans aurantiacus]
MSGGVRRVVATAEEARRALETEGWRVAVLDAGSRAELFAQAHRALGRTGGANLDALWDLLRDVEAPLALVWETWGEVAAADPGWFRRVLAVFEARAGEPGEPVVLVLL